jgi:hypothetical protein
MPELPAGILWMRVGLQIMAVIQGQIRLRITPLADAQLRRPITGWKLVASGRCEKLAKRSDGCSDDEVMATRWMD